MVEKIEGSVLSISEKKKMLRQLCSNWTTRTCREKHLGSSLPGGLSLEKPLLDIMQEEESQGSLEIGTEGIVGLGLTAETGIYIL